MEIKERINLLERGSRMIREIRENAGYSQQQVSAAIGMARSTLQRIENAEIFMPQDKLHDFLGMCGYSMQAFYMNAFSVTEPDLSTDEGLDDALCAAVKAMPQHSKKLLKYMIYDDWGGDWLQMVELSYMDSRTRMDMRVGVSEIVCNNYEICEARGDLRHPEAEPADVEGLRRTNLLAREAAIKEIQSY